MRFTYTLYVSLWFFPNILAPDSVAILQPFIEGGQSMPMLALLDTLTEKVEDAYVGF